MEDRELKLISGWTALTGVFLALGVLVLLIVIAIMSQSPAFLCLIIPLSIGWLISLFGFIVNGPNMARVVLLFGAYVGTVKDVGFFYGNPFYFRSRMSLRLRTLETGVTNTEERQRCGGKSHAASFATAEAAEGQRQGRDAYRNCGGGSLAGFECCSSPVSGE